jgi:hypothetical protein
MGCYIAFAGNQAAVFDRKTVQPKSQETSFTMLMKRMRLDLDCDVAVNQIIQGFPK